MGGLSCSNLIYVVYVGFRSFGRRLFDCFTLYFFLPVNIDSSILLSEKTRLRNTITLSFPRAQSLSVPCLLQICGYCFVIFVARLDLKNSKMLSPGNCPFDCRSL